MRLSIRYKIVLPFALVLVLVGVLGTAVASTETANAAAAQFDANLLHSSLTANQSLSQTDATRTAELRLATDTLGVPEALAGQDRVTLSRLLEPVVANSTAASSELEIVDASGRVVLKIQQGPNGPVSIPVAPSDSFASSADVSAVLRPSSSTNERRAFVWQEEGAPFVYWAGPVRLSTGEIVGAALLGEAVSEIAKSLPSAAFYGLSGQLLASRLQNPPMLTSSLLKRVPGGKALQTDQILSGHTYSSLISTWTMRGHTVGYVAIEAPKDALLALRDQLRLVLTLLFTGAAVLTLVVGVATASFLTRPIFALVQSMRTVSGGDLQHRARVDSQDEIGFLAKTFNEVTASLENKTAALEQTTFAAMEALAHAIDARDPMTYGHSERVAAISVEIADAMFMPEKEREALRRAALLHDLGKIGVQDRVLHKPGPLNTFEADEMREHSQTGYDILKGLPFLKPSLPGVLYHHERWDGNGYPVGLRGTAIPLQVRILSVADVLDALCSDRPYREGLSFEAAVAAIRNEAGLQFDPDVVSAFIGRSDAIKGILDTMQKGGVQQAEPEAA
jgi:putative nucleotidyltransferase with HDIG domain